MEPEAPVKRPGSAFARYLKKLALIGLVILLGVFAFFYWGVYERGVMAGKVLRISEQGVIFKTWEGKISLESFGALRGTSPIAEVYDFSVPKKDTAIIRQLEVAALEGARVNLRFIKRYRSFPWRGNTKVFVVSVERGQEQ
ncbi:MAG: hypothetical protein R6V75_07200 [Bacteroidales bacterium]